MRAVVQRVSKAGVIILHKIKAEIKNGLLVFVGIEDADTVEDIQWLSNKIVNLRIFDDENKVPNISVKDIDGDILAVSQFTLQASVKKGNRPSYIKASKAEIAKPVIIVSNDIEDVPFDLRALRILLYNISRPKWSDDLKTSITKSTLEILESPIDAVLPTFLNVTHTKTEEVSEIKKDLIEIKQFLYRLEEEEGEEQSKIIPAKEYGQAIHDAYRLYYDDGLDLSEIKTYLMEKFSIGISSASDIIDRARMKVKSHP